LKTKPKNPVRYRSHSPSYFRENYSLYQSNNFAEKDQYLFSIINLDFDQLLNLRRDLLNDYGVFFMRDNLFNEINYRISYLKESVVRNYTLRINKEDRQDLRNQREYLTSLIKKNTIDLEEYKVLKVRTLGSEEARASFDKAFYTLNDIYNQVIFYIDKYLIYYEMNENPHSEMSTMLLKRYNLPLHKPSKINQKNKIKKIPTEEVKPKVTIKEKLTPSKKLEVIYAIFDWLRLQNKWFIIKEEHLYSFIYKYFDFGNSDYDHIDIQFVLKTDANKWGVLFYELKANNLLTQTNEKICDLLSSYFCEFTNKKSVVKHVKKHSFKSAFENSDMRERHKLKKTNIPIDEIIDKLR